MSVTDDVIENLAAVGDLPILTSLHEAGKLDGYRLDVITRMAAECGHIHLLEWISKIITCYPERLMHWGNILPAGVTLCAVNTVTASTVSTLNYLFVNHREYLDWSIDEYSGLFSGNNTAGSIQSVLEWMRSVDLPLSLSAYQKKVMKYRPELIHWYERNCPELAIQIV